MGEDELLDGQQSHVCMFMLKMEMFSPHSAHSFQNAHLRKSISVSHESVCVSGPTFFITFSFCL